MRTNYILKVLDLASVSLPVRKPSNADWERVEDELQVKLPPDYKQIVSAVGDGRFGEIYLTNPIARGYGELTRNGLIGYRDNAIETLSHTGLVVYPDDGGALLIARCGNGIDLFAKPTPTGLYSTAILEHDYRVVRDAEMPLSEFLYSLYVDLIPYDWARTIRDIMWDSGEPFFTPLSIEGGSGH
jgi:hypothetical protein